jgi:fatty acid desaturase
MNSRREWRTVALVAAVYGGTAAVVAWHDRLGPWLSVPLLAWFGAWHLSMQHEVLHGHPFRRQWANDLLGSVPVTLWIPYREFRVDHLLHHEADLTDPHLDNESFYVDPERYRRAGRILRAAWWANRTILFRIFVWSIVSTFAYVAGKFRKALAGDRSVALSLVQHFAGVATVLWLVVGMAGMPWWQYALGVTYGGRILNAIRPFPEHRYVPGSDVRTAMVMAGPAMSLLMLNNNLHVAHHAKAGVAWYDVPRLSREMGAEQVAKEAGLHFPGGYLEVFRRFSFRPVDAPVRRA